MVIVLYTSGIDTQYCHRHYVLNIIQCALAFDGHSNIVNLNTPAFSQYLPNSTWNKETKSRHLKKIVFS